jgi:hypothetical protein
MGGKARFAAPLDVVLLPIAAQRDAGELVPSGTEFSHQVMAAAVREAEIANEQIKGVPLRQLQRRSHVAGHFDSVPFFGQHHPHHFRRDAVVFNQQNVQWADCSLSGILLDTDHISILQHADSAAAAAYYTRVVRRR